MALSKALSEQIYQVHFGGNWTVSNLQSLLADVSREEALNQVKNLNTIATLSFHIHYFVMAQIRVLEGKELNASDAESFAHPDFPDEQSWRSFVDQCLTDGKRLSELVAKLEQDLLNTDFVDPKYGTYYRNISGMVEHTHYHLGQISLIKKLIRP